MKHSNTNFRLVDGKEKPSHLGGHGNRCWTDEGVLKRAMKLFKPKSFVDVGCGTGEMVEMAQEKGLDAIGIDGDYTLERKSECIIHDYTTGEYNLPKIYDLCWSVEFLEHVEGIYIGNFMKTFTYCKHVIITHALPGKHGHHHVNCQPFEFWQNIFKYYGLEFDQDITDDLRNVSTMKKWFFKESGAYFKNTKLD